MKDYRFNYGFLKEWMEANKMTKRDVLNALQTKNYNGLNEWIDGIRPMHIEAIIRLCNTFDIPLGCFFFDNNARADIQPAKPNENDQVLPSNQNMHKRGRGVKENPISPVAEFHQETKIPDGVTLNIEKAAITDDVEKLKIELSYERKINEIKDKYNERINELRKNYDTRLSKKDEIIEQLHEKICSRNDLQVQMLLMKKYKKR